MRAAINIGLLLSFLVCYMEWGGGNSSFVFQAEYHILFEKKEMAETITHPIVLAGLLGQLALLISAFWQNRPRLLNILAIVLLGIIVLFVFLIGALSANIKMLASALPFLVLTIVYFRMFRKAKPAKQ